MDTETNELNWPINQKMVFTITENHETESHKDEIGIIANGSFISLEDLAQSWSFLVGFELAFEIRDPSVF